MKIKSIVRSLPRGRIAKWSKEQLDKLSTPEIRALLVNAERLKETEVAALCNELLDARPRGHAPVRRRLRAPEASRLVSRTRAFQIHGVAPRSRAWSRGGLTPDGTVLLALRAEDVQRVNGSARCLLWAPNVGDSQPWSDSPGGRERLEHCRAALEIGTALGVLTYGERVDAGTLLRLSVEKLDDAYWASWVPEKRIPTKIFE